MELMVLLFLLPAILAFALISRQSARIARLENEVAALKTRIDAPPDAGASVTDRVSEALVAARAEDHAEALAPEPVPPPAEERPPAEAPAAVAPRPSVSLETRFGARWPVYLGGIAMALGGLFLVRTAIEAGLLSPAVRLSLAAGFGLLLAAIGELIRRRALPALAPLVDRKSPLPFFPGIPGVLTAAGAIVLFGAIFAAQAVHGLLSPFPALVLLSGVALSTIALSLLHGQALAGLGLAGALAAPLMVSGNPPDTLFLFAYVTLCHLATLAICGLRGWRLVPVLSVFGYGGWMATMAILDEASLLPALGTALMLAGAVAGERRPLPARAETGLWAATVDHVFADGGPLVAAATLMALLNGFLAAAATYGDGGLHMTVIIAALAASAWLARGGGLALAAGLVATLGFPLQTAVMPEAALAGATLSDRTLLLALLIVFAGFGAASFARPRDAGAGRLLLAALVAAVPPLALIVFAHVDPDWHMIGADDPILSPLRAGLAALTLVPLFLAFAALADRHRPAAADRPGAAVNVTLIGLAVLALAFALARLLPPGAVLPVLSLATLAGVAALRLRDWPGLAFAPAVAFAVCLLTILSDATLVGPLALSRTPVFNALTPGYGIPALAFLAAARLLAGRPDPRPKLAMQAAGAIMTLLAVAVLIRHAMNDGMLYGASLDLGEQALYTLVVTGAAAVFLVLERREPNPVFHWLGLLAGAFGMASVLVLHGVVLNPLMTGAGVGRWPLVNLLAIAYLLPGLGYLVLVRLSAGRRPPAYRAALAVTALLLLFGFITLSVRQLYQGRHLALWQGLGQAENYSHSLAWLLFGIGLLVAGLLRRSRPLRLASAGVVLLAVLKAFLYDMAALEGVFRAASFIGLGAVLIGIGIVYQRLLPSSEPETTP